MASSFFSSNCVNWEEMWTEKQLCWQSLNKAKLTFWMANVLFLNLQLCFIFTIEIRWKLKFMAIVKRLVVIWFDSWWIFSSISLEYLCWLAIIFCLSQIIYIHYRDFRSFSFCPSNCVSCTVVFSLQCTTFKFSYKRFRFHCVKSGSNRKKK